MRIEVAGAQITDSVVDVLDDLQNLDGLTAGYLATLDEVTREMIMGISWIDADDAEVLLRLRSLQKIRAILVTLATPPDVDDPANDTPAASF